MDQKHCSVLLAPTTPTAVVVVVVVVVAVAVGCGATVGRKYGRSWFLDPPCRKRHQSHLAQARRRHRSPS